MHRTKNLIRSMIIFIFLSLIAIVLCESEKFYEFRQNVVSVFLFLDGKRNIISNIFIGILCSSVIALIGYVHEYISERKRSISELFYFYKYVRIAIIPKLGKETKSEILKLGIEYDKLYKIRELLEDYKCILFFFANL